MILIAAFAMQVETRLDGSIRDAKIVKPMEGNRFENMITYLPVKQCYPCSFGEHQRDDSRSLSIIGVHPHV